MKKLEDYKEEIHRCSKCGLCQAVCPIYKLTGNECTVSRGLFIMLDGVIKNKFKMNKNINKYLDMCLKCGKCENFCPSEIDITNIIAAAKYKYFEHSISGKIYKILESKAVFNNFLKIAEFVSPVFGKKKKSKTFDRKVVYFGGCISKLKPDTSNYVIKLLNMMNKEAVDIDFNCCGMPFLSTGNLKRFTEQLKENVLKLPDDIDCIVTDCASCMRVWEQYIKFADDENIREKLSHMKFKSIYELISENNIRFKAKNEIKVTYHKPCHETCDIEKIIESCENMEYEKLQNCDTCCGFAGFEHPFAVSKIYPVMKSKRNDIKKAGSKTVLTTCAGCYAGLRVITALTGKKIQNLLDFLKDNCCIERGKGVN